eukprot:jgi/Tetstr1/441352/TSEL_029603.t1
MGPGGPRNPAWGMHGGPGGPGGPWREREGPPGPGWGGGPAGGGPPRGAHGGMPGGPGGWGGPHGQHGGGGPAPGNFGRLVGPGPSPSPGPGPGHAPGPSADGPAKDNAAAAAFAAAAAAAASISSAVLGGKDAAKAAGESLPAQTSMPVELAASRPPPGSMAPRAQPTGLTPRPAPGIVSSRFATPAASPRPAAPSVPVAPGVAWTGQLAKSGAPLCAVQCAGVRGSGRWPACLDVVLRADLSYVVNHIYKTCPLPERSVQHLVAAAGEEHRRAFVKFLQYLGDRTRAGVVKLPPGEGQAEARTMYLVPPSTGVCESLEVAWEPRECMLALVVPASVK